MALTAFPNDDDSDDEDIVVLPGDTPLVRPSTLGSLVHAHREANAAATLLTARLPDTTGMGRIVRAKDGRISRIVEELDATEAELEIDEVGTSIYCFRRSLLAPALRRLSPENAQGEYYLTDVIEVLHDAGYLVVSSVVEDALEAAGVNDRAQLAVAEAELRARTGRDVGVIGGAAPVVLEVVGRAQGPERHGVLERGADAVAGVGDDQLDDLFAQFEQGLSDLAQKMDEATPEELQEMQKALEDAAENAQGLPVALVVLAANFSKNAEIAFWGFFFIMPGF